MNSQPEIAVCCRSPVAEPSPVVSVIIPTRDRVAMLRDAVDAIAQQDVHNMEVIVIDNASSDETPEMMTRLIAESVIPVTYVRLQRDVGPAGARNVGLDLASGRYIAFTDSDCMPRTQWLSAAIRSFASPTIGVVQGQTVCADASPPLFSHFIETKRLDGSFSTSNIVYRREAIDTLRFDPSRSYWEDTDLGWRVMQRGWSATFARDAIVRHQVVPLSPLRWVLWPIHYWNWPAKASRFPGFRRHLFLGVWVSPLHASFDLALAGVLLSRRDRRMALLTIPYVALFLRSRGLRGRAPLTKAILHVARDTVAFAALSGGSARHGSVVL
jgi:glycosyltransferase involved in cell wall biosynthesis